jgi:hypothetical protein
MVITYLFTLPLLPPERSDIPAAIAHVRVRFRFLAQHQ